MEAPMVSVQASQIAELPWKEFSSKAVGTAIIAAAAGYLIFGDTSSIYVAGMKVPGPLAMGLGAAAGSISADLAHQYVLPHIPHNKKYEQAEHASLSIIASGLGTYAAANMLGSAALVPAFTVGAGAYLGGDYTWHHFINKKEGGFLL